MKYKNLNQFSLIKSFFVRPHLTASLGASIILFLVLPANWNLVAKLLLAWDFGVVLYLIMSIQMMMRSNAEMIRKRAALLDVGEFPVLGLTVFGAIASLAAIMFELSAAKGLSGHHEGGAVALAAMTVIFSWVFMQTMFALHYAHAFYKPTADSHQGGLEFPGKDTKLDYWDFIYFSFIIGTAAQTADVNILSKELRRVVAIQCVTVFFFNTTILALAINVGAGLV